MCVSDVRIGEEHARHDRQMSSRPSPTVRPFLKWAGNKYRILAQIKAALPPGRRLIEPFVGSGAVFANTDYARYLLADVNPDLIAVYRHLQEEGPRFIEHCRSYFTARNNTGAAYYDLRPLQPDGGRAREGGAFRLSEPALRTTGCAATTNGGGFNVPFGRYRKPYFPAAEMAHFHERRAGRSSFAPPLVRRWRVRSRGMLSIAIRPMRRCRRRPTSRVTACSRSASTSSGHWRGWPKSWRAGA